MLLEPPPARAQGLSQAALPRSGRIEAQGAGRRAHGVEACSRVAVVVGPHNLFEVPPQVGILIIGPLASSSPPLHAHLHRHFILANGVRGIQKNASVDEIVQRALLCQQEVVLDDNYLTALLLGRPRHRLEHRPPGRGPIHVGGRLVALVARGVGHVRQDKVRRVLRQIQATQLFCQGLGQGRLATATRTSDSHDQRCHATPS
mmetsp:Transcript_101150/g.325864  ORF Transcript_101150/g.325864 Transcript_101150/m.325864 type:complete len:203 (-) Transcript_101150:84-692(-)